jgi:hypothetical protein
MKWHDFFLMIGWIIEIDDDNNDDDVDDDLVSFYFYFSKTCHSCLEA